MQEKKILEPVQLDKGGKNNPWRPVILYAVFGYVWILFSDRLLSLLVSDPEIYTVIQTLKGWLYVLITALLLYWLIRLENRKIFEMNTVISEKNTELFAYTEEALAMEEALKDQLDKLNTHEEELYKLAYYDRLTGLKNRIHFEKDVQKYLDEGKNFHIYYLDIDHFKNLNDIHGHYYGDLFLKAFASQLEEKFNILTLYRWGGDEFVVIDPINKDENVESLTNDLVKWAYRTWHLETVEFHTSTSIGVVSCPEHGKDVNTIFKNLEIALYRAKEAGRSRCVFFDASFAEQIERKSLIEDAINQALDNDDFYLNYQPIYDLESRQTVRLEVLLRFQGNPDLNTHIGEIIGVAEQTGQIYQIDDWVVRKAFAVMEENHHKFHDLKLAINISAQTFSAADFVPFLQSLLEDYKIDPQKVEFEITEHTIVNNMQDSYETMKKIKLLGFMMALDDFGTRYSSLNYLSRLPFDVLKVDKSYVDHVTEQTNDYKIVRQIIALAKSLGLETVAEGIELEEQEKVLAGLGCDYGQGYHYARPLTLERIIEKYGIL